MRAATASLEVRRAFAPLRDAESALADGLFRVAASLDRKGDKSEADIRRAEERAAKKVLANAKLLVTAKAQELQAQAAAALAAFKVR